MFMDVMDIDNSSGTATMSRWTLMTSFDWTFGMQNANMTSVSMWTDVTFEHLGAVGLWAGASRLMGPVHVDVARRCDRWRFQVTESILKHQPRMKRSLRNK